MMSRPAIGDIQTYLRDTGWQQEPRTWNGASIWSYPDGHEVLLPPHDDLADADLRVSEILAALTAVEGRPGDEIAGDINTPFDDVQLYRTFPDGTANGFKSLAAGLRELRSARDLVSAAARAVVEGPQPVFLGGAPGPVGELLQQIRLGPSRPGDHAFGVRVPLNARMSVSANGSAPARRDVMPLGRLVVRQLHIAVAAVQAVTAHAAAQAPAVFDHTLFDHTAFDQTVAAGGSANLCEALSGLAGRGHRQPFEVTFRWGRGLPAGTPAETIRFADGAGDIIRAAGAYLRQRGASVVGAVTGFVESLHGQPSNADYWLIKVRGNLTAQGDEETERPVWVRLADPAAYDRAIAAHLAGQRVRARGERTAAKGHMELMVNDEGFDVIE
jgi:hypothetical protein